MASKVVRFTASNNISAQPGTLERILFGSHSGAVIKVFDGNADGAATVLIGTMVVPPTSVNGVQSLAVHATFATGLYITVTPNAGNSVDFTALINGDQIR